MRLRSLKLSAVRAPHICPMLPPQRKSREGRTGAGHSDAIAKAVRKSGLRYAVAFEQLRRAACPEELPGQSLDCILRENKLNAIEGLNVLHTPRGAYFMENNLAAIGVIHGMGVFGNALLPDLKDSHGRDALTL